MNIKQETPKKQGFGFAAASVALALMVAGCSDDGDGYSMRDRDPDFEGTQFYRANNGGDVVGTVDYIEGDGTSLRSFDSGNNEGLELDSIGNLIQAGDASAGSLRTYCQIGWRADGSAYSTQWDRDITGANTGLMNPKGIAIADELGYVMAANFNAMSISVFGTAAAGDVAPVAITPLSNNAWDLTFDEANDRLYVALTNGTVAVFDDYSADGFVGTAARTIVPSDSSGAQVSVNLHGIVYEPSSDRLVLSDVGDAGSASDGALFVVDNASSADGNTSVSRMIAGPSTMLGNPVDIVLTDSTLRVAEKSNDAILIFADIFSGTSGDVAPDLITASTKPESLVEASPALDAADVSDMPMSSMTTTGLAVSSNPGSVGPTTGLVVRLSTELDAEITNFDTQVSVESATFDLNGDLYATFDDAENMMGGILIANRVAESRAGEAYTASRDRMIMGAATGLTSPKGLDVASTHGLVLVAEFGTANPGVHVFSSCASGNVSPLASLIPADSARPWDVDYDAQTDTAFVALTNGTVAVFDDVSAKIQQGMSMVMGEDRLIVPANSGIAFDAPTNIHGIDYVPGEDVLLISDVGSATVATDGKIYAIPAASTATGLTDVTLNIAGPASTLGNPVDIMFAGGSLYVAEKSNNLVLRFDDILTSAGGDVAAAASFAFTAPESVAILPEYLSSQPNR